MISTSEFEKGMIIKIDGQPWQILEHQFYKPGKGGAVMRTKLKNFQTGKVVDKTFRSGDKVEEMEVEYKPATFLYHDRHNGVFLIENQRISIPLEQLTDQLPYLKESSQVQAVYVEDKLQGITLPKKVSLIVKEAPPAIKGNTATAATKTVTLETGLKINVPIFIKEGESIIVNTDSGQYVERAKE